MRTIGGILAIVVTVFFLAGTGISNAASLVNNVTGKLQIVEDGGSAASVQFDASEASESQPAGGSLTCSFADQSQPNSVKIQFVKIDGQFAWLAGQCTSGDLNGRWLFVVAHDGGQPGSLVDHIWWEWLPAGTGENAARSKVENLEKPADNKSITDGNIVVSSYN